MPDNKAILSVRFGDGTTEQWTPDQYEQVKDKLYQADPKAKVVRSGVYNPEEGINNNDAFDIQFSDGATERWNGEQLGQVYDKLMQADPKAQIIQHSDLTTQYWKPKEDEAKARLDEFDALNREFINDFDARREKASASMSGTLSPEYKAFVDANGTKYDDLIRQREELRRDYYSNPLVMERYENNALGAADRRDEYEERAKNATDRAERKDWQRAAKLEDDIRKMYEAPNKYDEEIDKDNGFAKYLQDYKQGAWDKFSDKDYYTFGLSNIARNFDLRGIAEKVQNAGSEADIDQILTDSEKAQLNAFYNLAEAQMERADNISGGYTAGQTAAESTKFMAEFLLSQGAANILGRGMAASSNALKSWLGRQLMSNQALASAAAEKTAQGARIAAGVAREAAKAAPVRFASQVVSKPVIQGLWHTGTQLSTLEAISDNMMKTDSERELISKGQAIGTAVMDQIIENWSESLGGAVEGRFAPKFEGKTQFGRFARWLNESAPAKVLGEAGFNGLLGEIGEEWAGNAVRLGTGLMSKEEFKDFASLEQQLEMAASFAPMSLIGIGTASAAAIRNAKDYKDLSGKVADIMKRQGKEGEIENLLNTKYDTPEDIGKKLAPILSEISKKAQEEGATDEIKADYKTMLDFATILGKQAVLDEQQRLEQEGKRNQIRDDIQGRVGRFWEEGDESVPEDQRHVRVVTDAEGNRIYVTASDEKGVTGVSVEDGKPRIVDADQIQEDTTLPMAEYLQQQSDLRDQDTERQRMEQETAEQLNAVMQRVQPNTIIPMGTESEPVNATVMATDKNGAVLRWQTADGQVKEEMKPWSEIASLIGTPITVKTDAELAQDAAEAMEKANARAQTFNKVPAGTTMVVNLEEVGPVNLKFQKAVVDDGQVLVYGIDEDGNSQPYAESDIANLEEMLAAPVEEKVESNPYAAGEQITYMDEAGNTHKGKVAEADNGGGYTTVELENGATATVRTDRLAIDNEVPRDSRGKAMPTRINKETGQTEVDSDLLWKDDPQAWVEWNDSNPDSTVSSDKKLSFNINALNGRINDNAARMEDMELRGGHQDEVDAIREEQKTLIERRDQLQTLLNGRVAAVANAAAAESEAAPVQETQPAAQQAPVAYEQGTPQATYADIYGNEAFETAEEADGFVQGRIATATAEVQKAQKAYDKVQADNKAGKYASPAEFARAKAQAQQDLAAAQSNLDHWNGVKAIADNAVAEAQKAAEAEEQMRMSRESEEITRELEAIEIPQDESMIPGFRDRLQALFARAGQASDKANILRKLYDAISGGERVVVLTRANALEVAANEGFTPNALSKLKAELDRTAASTTENTRAFAYQGKIFVVGDDIVDIENGRTAFVHERQHKITDNKGYIAPIMAYGIPREKWQEWVYRMSGSRAYEKDPTTSLMHEALSMAMEIAYSNEAEDVEQKLRDKGVDNEDFINFIKTIDNEQRNDQSLRLGRRTLRGGQHQVSNVSEQGSVRQDSGNQGSGAGEVAVPVDGTGTSGVGRGDGIALSRTGQAEREQRELTDKITAAMGGETEDGTPVMFSRSSIFEGAGFTAAQVDDAGNKTPLSDSEGNVIVKMGDKVFSAKNPVTIDDLKANGRSSLNIMLSIAEEKGTIDGDRADIIRGKFADILNLFLREGAAEKGGWENLNKKWLWLGDTVFRTVATNGDKQYSYSMDITRVCKKNEAVIRAISALQKRQGYGATPAQIMDIYQKTLNRGYQVPCPVCYVFSRYLRNGKYASAAINGMLKYGEHLPNGKDPWTAERWDEEVKSLDERYKKAKTSLDKANADVERIFEAIDRRAVKLLDKNTSAAEKKKLRAEIEQLDAQYRAAINLTNQVSLKNWINTFAIQSVDGEVSLRDDARMPEDMQDFADNALDLRKVGETMRKYPAIQRLRRSGGSAAGKEITFESNNELGEIISGVGTGNPSESVNWFQIASQATTDEEFDVAMAKAKEAFDRAYKYAQRQTLRGGQRMWSWSDNIESLSPDVAVNLMQMELLGGALQSYSKQLEGIAMVAAMDGYVNGSLMAKDDGVREVSDDMLEEKDGMFLLKEPITETIDENTTEGKVQRTRVLAAAGSPALEIDGKKYVLIFDDIIGVDPHGRDKDGKHKMGLFDLNKQYSRAGNILVGMNDKHVRTAMADGRIYFIIPWHSSGQSVHILQSMLGYLGSKLGIKATDYTAMQEEKSYDKKKDSKTKKEYYPTIPQKVIEIWESHKNETDFASGIGPIESGHDGQISESQLRYRELRSKIFDGTLSDDELRQVQADAFLRQVYEAVQAHGGTMTATDNGYIYPYEYWNKEGRIENADENAARYIEYCRRLGVCPKFSGKWGKNGAWSDEGNFIDDKGYWKLLIDRRMYDVDGNYQDLTPTNSAGFEADMVDPAQTEKKYVSTTVADDSATDNIVDDVQKVEDERAALAGKGSYTIDYGLSLEEAQQEYDDSRSNIKFSRTAEPQAVDNVMAYINGTQAEDEMQRRQTEELFARAKERFGTTEDIREAGYVLPDGTMLDFSGRHWMEPGSDTSYLAGDRQVDHRDIADLAYERDGNTPTGIETSMADFIDRGAIRIHNGSGAAINLAQKPTAAQQARLRRLIDMNGGDVWVDFGNGDRSDHYVEYGAAKSARVLNDINRYFDEGYKPEGTLRFSLRGEKGAQTAQDAQALANLVVAEQMEEQGKDAKTIWLSTGWERGKDGEWRNEIPDGMPMVIKNTKNATVKDVIIAPELFESYPQLADIKIKFNKSRTYSGSYDRNTNTIGMHTDNLDEDAYTGKPYLSEEGMSTMMHELQHVIQSIEGFARGGNPAQERTEYLKEMAVDLPELVTFSEIFSRTNPQQTLLRAGRQKVADLARKNATGYTKEIDMNALADRLDAIDDQDYAKMVREGARLQKLAWQHGESRYERLAGEVESRNVQKRMGMSDASKSQTPPSETEDIRREDQGVRFSRAQEANKVPGQQIEEAAEQAMPDSKVRGADGKLLKMYHGTSNAGFNVFKKLYGKTIGWFTSSKRDADSYAGNDKGKEYEPGEKEERVVLKAGTFRLNDHMVFDSQADLEDFVKRFPNAKDYMSAEQMEEAINDSASEREERRLRERKAEYDEMAEAYSEYEKDHLVSTTIGELMSNPDAYTLNDFKRAIYAYDSNAYLDDIEENDEATQKAELLEALNYFEEESAEDGGIKDITFESRVPRGGEGVKASDLHRRTYAAYLNIVNPYIIDAGGRHSEFESGEVYKAVEEAMVDDQYDGVLIKNWRVGRYQELGDVAIPKKSSQIKLVNAITRDDNGEEIPLSERFNPANDDIRFSRANENQRIFVSNAEAAVDAIPMAKATPQQWLKMIESKGGLKAGEDKWIGLSDWLKEQDAKTLTKQDVQDYIAQNQIQIEETRYSEPGNQAGFNEKYPGFDDAFWFEDNEITELPMVEIYGSGIEKAVELYNNAHPGEKIEIDEESEWVSDEDEEKIKEWALKAFSKDSQMINPTRLNYTTEGLDNKREIALTVPTIEPWNERDQIHFGDAGEGRAVAWVRFGDAEQDGQRVLFIDEIQSKRHQEGREKGYGGLTSAVVGDYTRIDDDIEIAPITDKMGKKIGEMERFKGDWYSVIGIDGVRSRGRDTEKAALKFAYSNKYGIPAAPFEKNWHELAMKRMLRLAAEEGYDYVAWTTGDQQAERYDLSEVINYMRVVKRSDGSYTIISQKKDGTEIRSHNGITADKLPDIVGKDLAQQIISEEGFRDNGYGGKYKVFSGLDLKVGGEGMRGFYDQMLPRYMDKYGKKWGVKTEDMELPNLAYGITAHAIPVTEEMKESVMEGQLMFSRAAQAVEQADEGGIQAVVGSDNAKEFAADIYRAMPAEMRRTAVDKAMGGDLNIHKALVDDLSRIAYEGYENDEAGILRAAGKILSYYAGENLDEATVRYILWRNGQPNDLLTDAQAAALKKRWGVGEDLRYSREMKEDVDAADNAAEATVDEAAKALSDGKRDLKDMLTATRAMRLQKEYDKKTIEAVTNLAKQLLKDQSVSEMSRRDIARLLGLVRTSAGRSPRIVKRNADTIVEIVVDNLLKKEKAAYEAMTKKTGTKTNATGVEVQGELDLQGQKTLKAYKEGLKLKVGNVDDSDNENTLYGMKAKVQSRLNSRDDAVRAEAEAEDAGLTMAIEYQEGIAELLGEEKGLEAALDDLKAALAEGEITKKAYDEAVESTTDAIRANHIDQVEAYRDFATKMRAMLSQSREDRAAFVQEEKDRVNEIHHLANSDMQGKSASRDKRPTFADKLANNPIARFAMAPLATFDQMLRLFGEKSINGEGYLWNRFMSKWQKATENEYTGQRDAKEKLDKKVSEVFGKKMIWSDLYDVERKMPKVTARWWDDGAMRDHELTQGQLLYIYMVNKMADGRMKLRRMGIEQEHVDAIVRQMDERFLTLADWLQEEFLVDLRNKYNAVHERLFGASMAAIDDYFPLVINKRDLERNEDVGLDTDFDSLPSTTTGSIIKRKRNNKALDLMNADAFSVVIDHIDQMEKWAAFAEFNKDVNALLSYKRFRNQVQNMASVYGSGTKLWDNFKSVAKIAAGSYKPKRSNLDKDMVNIAKGVTAAKISFRVYTALNQTLSSPAFLADASMPNLAKSLATAGKSWSWAMENLPIFEKRWKSRIAGDTRLMQTDLDWNFYRQKLYDKASKLGMSPNAFVDAVTVAVGAKAIYDTKYAQFKSEGFSDEDADRKAKTAATVLVNETQQSSEGAFVSPVQLDRTVLATMITVFRNSSMGFQRQVHDSLRNLGKHLKPGYKEQSLEFTKKQLMRDGLTEEQAEQAANKRYNKSFVRDATRLAVFGFLVEFSWNLGSYIVYLLFGDDDDKKKEMLADAARHAMFGGLIEGLAGGNVVSEGLNTVAQGESLWNYDPQLLPLFADIKSAYSKMSSDPVSGWNDVVNLAIQAGVGVNPQTLTDAVVAVADACDGDLETSKEAMLLIMRVLQVPQSQVDELYIDELGTTARGAQKMSYSQMAQRYADYKIAREAPLTGWAYSDEARKKREKSKKTTFKKKVNERKK